LLVAVGRTLISSVGGVCGPLYGSALRRAGKTLGQVEEATAPEFGEAMAAAADAVRELGGAAPGDKTMVDAWCPAVQAYRAALGNGADAVSALAAAASAALAGADATVAMQARKGRASCLGERSIGHRDPGAASSALLLACLRDAATTGAAVRGRDLRGINGVGGCV
jgi:dihydroxyacetone kinase-like protein